MESLSDIVAQMRGRGEDGRMDRRLWLDYADRIEAAWKREKAEIEANALTVGGIVEAERRLVVVSKTETTTVGNAAAMYEALVKIAHYCDDQNGMDDPYCADGHILSDIARAALSAPVRNCDVPLVVDGPATNNADKAWNVFKYRNPGVYFDVPGLLRCIEWLLAPAAERKGESDGR